MILEIQAIDEFIEKTNLEFKKIETENLNTIKKYSEILIMKDSNLN